MTAPGDRFSANHCARAFMRTAQYMASILPGAKILAEVSQIVRAAFAVDTVTFVSSEFARCLPVEFELAAEVQATIVEMVRQVLENGFMATEATSAQQPAVWIAFPVTVRGQRESVMLVGYRGQNKPPHHLLESLLGVAALLGSTLESQLTVQELRDSMTQTRLILDAIGDGVCRVDMARMITFANKAALEIVGGTEQQLIGSSAHDLAIAEESFDPTQEVRREVTMRRRDGTSFPADLICVPISSFGLTSGFVITFSDNTEKNAKAALSEMAYHDPLTKLPNRRLLIDRIRTAISSASRHKLQLAVMFVDIDMFKQINDGLGHFIGDQVLVEVASRLCQCVRAGDTVSRLGGDEFVILQLDIHQPEEAVLLAERLIGTIKQPIYVSGHALNATVSIGIALYPEGSSDPESLLRIADDAMYGAKNAGRSRYLLNSQPKQGISSPNFDA